MRILGRHHRPSPLDIAGRSEPGPRRAENQDRWAAGPSWALVCDGVGGHAGGAVAAQTAVDAATAHLGTGPVRSVAAAENRLRTAIDAAHAAVAAGRSAGPTMADLADLADMADMATTLTAAVVIDGRRRVGRRWVVAQVGDSPAWLVGPTRALSITWDHNLVGELVRAGAIRPEQAIGHRGRNMVTRALGPSPTVEPELFVVDPDPGDVLVLASDGLSDVAGPDDAIGLDTPDALVSLAQERGTMDDVTVVVAR